MRRSATGISLLVATLLFALLAAPGAPDTSPGCYPAKSRTIIETSSARVFSRRVSGARRLYGCLLKERQLHLIARLDRVGGPLLAGQFVAYTWERENKLQLRVFDLTLGRVVNTPARYSNRYAIPMFVVNDKGSVAWVVFDTVDHFAAEAEVYRFDQRGVARLYGSRYLDTSSLALAANGTNLYWRERIPDGEVGSDYLQ